MKSFERTRKVYILDRAAVDMLSEEIQEFLEGIRLEKRNRIRIRFAMEDLLLRVCEHYKESVPCTLEIGRRIGRPYISFRYGGEMYNPTTSDNGEDQFSRRLLVDMGFAPVWSRKGNQNHISLWIHEEHRFAALNLPLGVAAGIIIGSLGFLLPEEVRSYIDANVLSQFFYAFLGVLSTFASLSLFLFLSSAVSNLGDIVTYGRYGKKVMNRFIGLSFAAAVTAMVLYLPFFHLTRSGTYSPTETLSELLNLIASILPGNPMSPFINNDSMQLIFMGVVMGVGLVVMGESARQLRGVLTQSNSLVTFLMESVSRYSPLFIALTVVSHIWNSRLSEFYDMWKPVAVYLILVVGMWLSMLFFTAKKYHVPWKWLLQKLKPAMIISLQTASAGASYGEAENALTHRFGVPKRLTDFALPIGQTMYMPATICAFIATAYFLTETYHVEVDLTWFIVAAVVCTMMAIALPPIPGSGIGCYAIMLARLEIPYEAIGAAIVLDIFFTFTGRAIDSAMLQMELIHSADSLGILNRKLLEKQK